MTGEFNFDDFDKYFSKSDASPEPFAFSQTEIDKMNMEHMTAIPKRVHTKITGDIKQFSGPRRGGRPNAVSRKNFCEKCNVQMEKDQLESGITGYICNKCGKQGEFCYDNFVDDIDRTSSGNDSSTYNTYASSSAPLTITGPNGQGHRRGMISGNVSYKKSQERTTRTQFQKILLNSEVGQKIPQEISRDAENLFLKIQENRILRAQRRMGTMAACLDLKCRQYKMPRKCKEISQIFGIQRNMLSVGHGILDGLIEGGLIDASGKPSLKKTSETRDNPEIVGYINRYFESLNIPLDDGFGRYDGMDISYLEELDDESEVETDHPNYKQFALDLIRFAQCFKISDASMDSSKCAGTIYIIAMRFDGLNIPVENIEKECDISKTTFCKFSKEIERIMNTDNPRAQKTKRKLRHLFKKYEIPLK